jgi:hypothetical protein
MSVFQIINRSI